MTEPEIASYPALNLTQEAEQLRLMKALANPVRLEILKFLHQGPSCVSLSCMKLGVSQPNLSKHLQILREAGMINCRERGTEHCYFICRPSVVGPLLALFESEHSYKPCSKPEQHK